MTTRLEVTFTPAEFEAFPKRDLSQSVCVVFDVLRATSTMVTALANGAAGIIPVADIPSALRIREKRAEVLLAGERDGVRIRSSLTGSIDFDLGNSPREFKPETVAGEYIVMTTTNGTRALAACCGAQRILIGSFLNLQRVADYLLQERPASLVLVCSGTHEESAYEDSLGAGALCELIWNHYSAGTVSDSAVMARQLYLMAQHDPVSYAASGRNGRRLMSLPDLRDDVPLCLQRDLHNVLAQLDADGIVRRVG